MHSLTCCSTMSSIPWNHTLDLMRRLVLTIPWWPPWVNSTVRMRSDLGMTILVSLRMMHSVVRLKWNIRYGLRLSGSLVALTMCLRNSFSSWILARGFGYLMVMAGGKAAWVTMLMCCSVLNSSRYYE